MHLIKMQPIIIEVSALTCKRMIHTKIKLGWFICSLDNYLVPIRCFKCSKYNHRSSQCRGLERRPLCAGSHKMKECSAQADDYKCINCQIFNMHNKNAKISENHSSMDKNCPSLKAKKIHNNYQNTYVFWHDAAILRGI